MARAAYQEPVFGGARLIHLAPGVPGNMDYYNTLEVAPNASDEVISAAYRALMKMVHPDRTATVGSRARKLNEAYETLSDPVRRARYDRNRLDLGGKVIGEFRIEKPIAEGGFGKTYLGRHVMVGEPVCIKHCSRISALDTETLIEEAKAMWDLRHFSVPAVRNLLRLDDGSVALVMSYVPGPTFAEIVETAITKRKPLDAEDVAWISERVITALSYIHRHGVVHGDIKPQNIIVQPDTHTVVLVDFGLAAVKPSHNTANKGYTDYFAPPEQKKGQPLIPQIDFYSLGMTMLYALVGGDVARLERKAIPPTVPTPMMDFMRRLLLPDPLARPDWSTEDLVATFRKVRTDAFGRSNSAMKPLPI